VRVFKVDHYGAPAYPELVLTASRKTIERDPDLVDAVVAATTRGYHLAATQPDRALADLLAEVPSLDRADQAAQMQALGSDLRPAPFDPRVLREWAAWDLQHGLLEKPLVVEEAFRLNR